MKKFEGKTVLVTGAGKNIGKDIAISFAKEGANVVVCDYNQDAAHETVKEIKELNCDAMEIVCDVRDSKKVFEGVEAAVEKFQKIDVLVNNAGGSAALIGKLSEFVDAEEETLDFVIDVNLKGTMNCIRACLKSMIENNGGKIINMASIAGLCGMKNRVDYSAAKGGVIAMTKALAMEVGKYNICVNCISPGAIGRDGYMMKNMTYLGADGRGGKPKDIAETVLFLAGHDFITGENITVDGGRTLGPMTQEVLK